MLYQYSYKPGRLIMTLVLVLLMMVVGAAFVWKLLAPVLIEANYTQGIAGTLGWAINGFIALVFLLGIAMIFKKLQHYKYEFHMLKTTMREWSQTRLEDDDVEVDENSIVGRRIMALYDIHKEHGAIDQSALAASVVAHESTRTSSIRFIHNILILLGVFGTIISLSVALFGAAELLQSQGDTAGMNVVFGGMSTALSTTMTAIVCYIVFGYFHAKLNDVQTHYLADLEHATTTYLLPRFHTDKDALLKDVHSLVNAIRQVAVSLQHVQQESSMELLLSNLRAMENGITLQTTQQQDDMARLHNLLQQGFRLPSDAK